VFFFLLSYARLANVGPIFIGRLLRIDLPLLSHDPGLIQRFLKILLALQQVSERFSENRIVIYY
ncbi:MAG: hypothetical protein PHV74_13575, partial [Dehalococcoidia bacterium]|nr:hypothetical protein [Dehalococcoidia bacterium]